MLFLLNAELQNSAGARSMIQLPIKMNPFPSPGVSTNHIASSGRMGSNPKSRGTILTIARHIA